MTTCSGRAWSPVPADENQVQQLAASTGLPVLFARLLWLRGVRSREEADSFLHPSTDQLFSPLLLRGIAVAVPRILRAVRDGEPILIYGDYDVDGTLATVLLKTAIDRVTPRGKPSLVRYHVPHRIREGYGVQASVLKQAAEDGVRLVISVDTGIRAFAAADEAQALGLDLIVTDHHLPDERGVPHAAAVVNPNQSGCDYPEKYLCGAGVAWKLAEAVLREAGAGGLGLEAVSAVSLEKLQRSLLKLVAIATVADAVPLTGENRVIVAIGLAELREVRQPGLRALMKLAQVGGYRAPLASEVAFRIAPRINAAGRMDVASDVVRLLLTREPEEAEALATRLHTLNEDRRTVEAGVLQQIHERLDALLLEAQGSTPPLFVLDGEGWHRGVIGILASRVVDRIHRPALVITHEDGAAHGSGRSVEGFHLLEALTAAHAEHMTEQNEELFLRFGGHAHAVGFSLPSQHVQALRRRLLAHASQQALPLATRPDLRIEAELPLEDVTAETWGWLCRMQPFGNANEEPVFMARCLRVLDVRPLKERHVKLLLQPSRGPVVTCLGWARSFDWPQRAAECSIVPGAEIDIAFQVRWNDRPDFEGLEIHVCDLRLSQAVTRA